RGLRLRQVQLLLEVLVHDIDHAVAQSPEEEQRTYENKREGEAASGLVPEHSLIGRHRGRRMILTVRGREDGRQNAECGNAECRMWKRALIPSSDFRL